MEEIYGHVNGQRHILSEFLWSTMAASTSVCMATETHVDYLKEAKLVPPRHSKSKVWCYFGFKEQGSNNEFVYCALCTTKLKYYRNTTNFLSHFKSQHALKYTQLELLKIKPPPLPSELSGVIGSTPRLESLDQLLDWEDGSALGLPPPPRIPNAKY